MAGLRAFGQSVFDRTESASADEISRTTFNLIMGAVLFWGFAINGIICCFFSDMILGLLTTAGAKMILIIGYLVLAFGGVYINVKSDKPAISFLGYNMVVVPMGIVLVVILANYQLDVISSAFFATAIMCAAMVALSSFFPSFFMKLGPALFAGIIIGIIAQIACMFLLPSMVGIFDWIFVVIFGGYIGYDWSRSQKVAANTDNAIDCACALYIDIINLFIRLLRIMGRR